MRYPALAAPASELGPRLGWAAVLAVVTVGLCLLAWRGWRRRVAAQAGLGTPAARPGSIGAQLLAPVPGVYVCSTRAGDWLARIVVRDLGIRSRADVRVTEAGVLFERAGASDLFIPAAWLRGVRRSSGVIGKVVPRDRLVVLTWDLGDQPIDTAFLPSRRADGDALTAAAGRLITAGTPS